MTPNTRHSTLLTKVPEVTAIFWLTKVLTTGVGESQQVKAARGVDVHA